MRKVSLNKLLRSFNDELQVDFMLIKELTEQQILHMKDKSTEFCAATITQTRDQDEAAKAFEERWITIHGPPVNVGFDPEFDNYDFGAILDRHGIKATPRPARKHNKTGSVEAGNATLRIIATRILRDSKHLRDTKGITFTQNEILARATLACNVLRANKKLCPFELAKGYMPAIAGFAQTPVESEVADAHVEQVTRRALKRIFDGRVPRTLAKSLLAPKTKVYFFEKKTKQRAWTAAQRRSGCCRKSSTPLAAASKSCSTAAFDEALMWSKRLPLAPMRC